MKRKIWMALIIIGGLAALFVIDAKRPKFKAASQIVQGTVAQESSKSTLVDGKFPDKNLLSKEKSPYLLQHANNPVHWYPWGDEAFAKAKAEDKPVFLSIGYSTCHWCHVMEHE